MAVVIEGSSGRCYVDANDMSFHDLFLDSDIPNMELAYAPRYMVPELYGLEHYKDLFTNRQLKMLKTLVDLLPEIKREVISDAGHRNDFKNKVLNQPKEFENNVLKYFLYNKR